MAFTNEELQLISEQRKTNADLPEYYSAQSQTSIQISRDFEAYLILQTQDQKQKVLEWIRKALIGQSISADRDTLLNQYIQIRKADAQSRIAELDQKLGNFNDFKTSLLPNDDYVSNFGNVAEISLLCTSLQKPMDELFLKRDQAYHEVVLSDILNSRLTKQKQDANTKKELQSWQTVIASYKGRPSGLPIIPTPSLPSMPKIGL